MGRSFKPTLHYKEKGGQPYDSITTSCSAPIIRGVFTMDLVKTWALSPKTCLGGIPRPTVSMTNDPYIHQSPNQLGIHHIWLIHPTKWGYTNFLYMKKIQQLLNFPSLAKWGYKLHQMFNRTHSNIDHDRRSHITP